ncbi:MAG: beta-lactamase family protein [Saprospiraceae bacterium]|nr:beta-lactamase family protein [Saprospiraceae bacterium]
MMLIIRTCAASFALKMLFVFLVLFVFAVDVLRGQAPNDVRMEFLERRVDSLVSAAIDQRAFPGAQVVMGDLSGIRFQKSYGHHTYAQDRRVEDHHLYDLASVTKVAAAVPALMYLVDQDLIELDEPIGKYLSWWDRGNKRGITFRRALAHFARLKPYLVFWQMAQKKNGAFKRSVFADKPSEKHTIKISEDLYMNPRFHRKMFRAVAKSDLIEEQKYLYSGLTFLFYPQLILDLTGKPIDVFLRDEIFGPIDAERITFRPADYFPLDEIVPTEQDTFFRNRLVKGAVHDENAAMLNGLSTNAGLFASGGDLAKLCQLYLGLGAFEEKSIISHPVFKAFTQCQYCEEGNRRGLGFDKPMIEYNAKSSYVAESASASSFGHSGFTGTFIWVDPEMGFYLVFLSNRVYPDRSQRGLYSSGFRPALHQLMYDAMAK